MQAHAVGFEWATINSQPDVVGRLDEIVMMMAETAAFCRNPYPSSQKRMGANPLTLRNTSHAEPAMRSVRDGMAVNLDAGISDEMLMEVRNGAVKIGVAIVCAARRPGLRFGDYDAVLHRQVRQCRLHWQHTSMPPATVKGVQKIVESSSLSASGRSKSSTLPHSSPTICVPPDKVQGKI
jgi:hypothetical protein